MDGVWEYVYSVTVVCAVGGTACYFIPFENEKNEKFVRYILSLVVLFLLVSPVFNFLYSNNLFSEESVNNITDNLVREYESIASDTRKFVISDGVKNVEKRIGEAVARRYSVSAQDISVEVETCDDGETISITNIIITLDIGAFSLDPDAVVEYVSELCGCSCEVNFK